MNKINKVLQTLFSIVIIASGVFLFTQQDANAFRTCDDRSYGGEEDPNTYECIKKSTVVDCFVCIAKPIEEKAY